MLVLNRASTREDELPLVEVGNVGALRKAGGLSQVCQVCVYTWPRCMRTAGALLVTTQCNAATSCLILLPNLTLLPRCCASHAQAAVATARDERKQLSKEAGLAADAELAHQLYECSQV